MLSRQRGCSGECWLAKQTGSINTASHLFDAMTADAPRLMFVSPRMHMALIGLIGLTGCSYQPEVSLALTPVPYEMKVPAGILPRLSTGPVEGPFGEEVRQAGALASASVYYNPVEEGAKTILLTAYWFPAEKFDALQRPDQPSLVGTEVLRVGGNVLSVAGPLDAIFAPDTPDGRNLTALCGAIYLPETYVAGGK